MATDFMTLKATLGLDSSEYEGGMKNAEGRAKGFGSKWGMAMKAVKVGAAAIGTAAVAVAGLAKKSVDSYAEYEQMVGGVKKLYGNMGLSLEDYADSVGKSVDAVSSEYNKLEKAQNLVLDNAKQAYKTTGMSANEYMSTATSFSAALINSLGGDSIEAAKQTDVAMRAISDNFNTFGGDISMIQGAFQGFAKQNYTMLDNLKLGYGGTKTEMERLIKDANEWGAANGKASDLSIDSFSDVVTAIDQIQQKQQIAGTTAREASTTIEGSLMTVKAAWQNLLTGFADPDANIANLVQQLVESVSVAASNIGPAFVKAVQGIGQAFSVILPNLVAKLPEAIRTYGKPLLKAGTDLVRSLVQGISKEAPALISAAFGLAGDFILGLAKALPDIIIGGLNLITGILEGIGQGEGELLSKIGEILAALGNAIVVAAPELAKAMLNLVKALGKAITQVNFFNLAKKAFNGVKTGIQSISPSIKSVVKSIVTAVINLLGFSGIKAKVTQAFQQVVDGAREKMQSAKNTVSGWINSIKNLFPFNIGKIFSGWVPKISATVNKNTDGGGSMSVREQRMAFAKAMSQPYLFKNRTTFRYEAGEAGEEVLMGRQALKNDLAEAVKGAGGSINIYLNYNASDDANDMVRDIARGVQRYKMAGAI